MATLFDDASLVMLPSGYKDDKLYSIKPTDGSGDFTFSRDGSGASPATRVNSAGLIEKGRTNLLLQSNQFDTTWSGAVTTTSGQSGYDGTNNAWLIENTASSAYIRQTNTTSGVLTASIYAKAGNVNWMRFAVSNSPIVSIYFDLVNGVGYGASNLISHDIEDVGNGWHRYSVSFLANSMSGMQWYPADGNNDLGEVGDNILIQNAQLEKGLVATNYIATTTAAASAGILGDMPRLDYSGGATCPSLLLEPARTNLITQSEYLAAYGVTGTGTITTNSDISPEGAQNAFTMTDNDSGNYYRLTSDGMSFNGNPYTMSCFVKKTTGTPSNYPAFEIGALGTYLSIDTTNGVAQETSGGPNYSNINVESYGDYWRVSATCTPAAGTQFLRIWPALGSTLGAINANATGSATFYGFQIEAGSYPTSYIPTHGSATARGADSCSKTGVGSLIGQTEGTLFAEFEIKSINTDNFNRIIAIGDGTSNNRIMIFANNDEKPRAFISDSGATQVSIIGNTSILGGTHKIAFAYKANDFVLYMDGVSLGTDTSGSVPSISNIYLASAEDSNIRPIEGGLKQALVFKTRLTNAELAALTTL